MENTTDAPVIGNKGTFPAKVAKVIDNHKLVINRGSEDGIREGQRMLVYKIDDEAIIDPDTGKSLGNLELVRGTGEIIYVQEKISILESDRTQLISSKNARYSSSNSRKILSPLAPALAMLGEREVLPFDKPQIGDEVKPI
jgi:hypothetical protein